MSNEALAQLLSDATAAKTVPERLRTLQSLAAALTALEHDGAAEGVNAALGAIVVYSRSEKDDAALRELSSRIEACLLIAMERLATALTIDLVALGERKEGKRWAELAEAIKTACARR